MNFLVIGESLVDVTSLADGSMRTVPGGSPLNVAVGLGRLGQAVTLLTQFADDSEGRLVREHLVANGVTAEVAPQRSTSVAHATIRPDGSADYRFDIEWSPDFSADSAAGADVVHAGSIGAHLRPGADATYQVLAAARSHALTSYDPNCRPSILGDAAAIRADIERFVGVSDIVKASDEDLAFVYPGMRYQDVARLWLRGGARLVVVTRGSAGVWCATSDDVVFDAPTVAVNVVDTIGAGDAFMSSLLHGLVEHAVGGGDGGDRLLELDKNTLLGIVQQAARSAAITCTRSGANPPTLTELELVKPRRVSPQSILSPPTTSLSA